MSLLLTVWDADDGSAADQFLGEVLLDVASVDVRGASALWFDLQEHDLNCTSLATDWKRASLEIRLVSRPQCWSVFRHFPLLVSRIWSQEPD